MREARAEQGVAFRYRHRRTQGLMSKLQVVAPAWSESSGLGMCSQDFQEVMELSESSGPTLAQYCWATSRLR